MLPPGHAPACFLGEQLVALFLYCPSAHVAQVKPSFVPAHAPWRCWPAGHATLAQALHAKLLAVPPQVPVRNCPPGHFALSHDVHVPFFTGLEPARYVPDGQVGWVAQTPFLVVLKLERYLPVGQVGWSTHVPLLVADCPDRYLPAAHSPCLAHVNPSVRPVQAPDRKAPLGQSTLLQGLHSKLLAVPAHVPACNSFALHWALSHV